ncbi:class I SAM-dependent methyltransferase [Pseudodesulfovibrio pelocollis]|uniref:class I SAM-dependent methyltransferase n=1 Tax=Pseudodesulfovibrio pelocollis TaxID=3051432 RepID=UPI00255A8372|nr:class I SAM-dependent methyltransferase [Pseudodesulfovibrio sp. SB368]
MNCRHCNKPLTHVFIDLGHQPLSNSFLDKDQLSAPEEVYPLKVLTCSECFLVQVDEHKNASEIFNHGYVYYSSYSSSWLDHARRYTEMVVDRFGLGGSSVVVEIASNDGYLLQYMKERDIPCYGIEPSSATAMAAWEKGIESVTEFFSEELAARLARERGRAALIVGNNVLAHVPNINDFVRGISLLLDDNGVATLEFPHLMRLVDDCQFDTIYHEHFSYLSLRTVQRIFSEQGLCVFDVEELPTHGGSLRVFVRHDANDSKGISPRIGALLVKEKCAGMTTLHYYTAIQAKADIIRDNLLSFLEAKRVNGKRVAAYGAAAKGNTLLNYCGVGVELIEYCVDASPHKQGLFMPGSRIPVLAPTELYRQKPDYVLILPWNIKDEVVSQHSYIREWGGRFVTAIPRLLVDGEHQVGRSRHP